MGSGNGSLPDIIPGHDLDAHDVTRGEFESLKARTTVVEGQAHSIDGGEQDLREQLRTMRRRILRPTVIVKDEEGEREVPSLPLDKDKSIEARIERIENAIESRIPAAWTQKAIVTFMVSVAMALLSKALGVPMPEIVP